MPANLQGDRIPTSDKPASQPDVATVLHTLRGVPSRRDVLRGLATAGLGLGLASLPTLTEAKPKPRKRKRPKPSKPNRFGCLEVKDSCRTHRQCCSGICTGKPGKKRCRAHGTKHCKQGVPGVCSVKYGDIYSLKCAANCLCYRTTAGSNFCSQGVYFDQRNCTTCKRDADCVALGFPPGSACAPIPKSGICAGLCDTGMACLAPCAIDLPDPPDM